MKHRDLISGIFWLAVGMILTLWSTRYTVGSIVEPGPGFLPLGLGILLIFLSIIVLLGARKSSPAAKVPSPSSAGGEWKRVAYAVLVMIVTASFFEKVGYLITFFLLVMLLMAGAGGQSWKRILLVALFTAAGVYLVFVLLLEQPLPSGILRF
jgi:putative tricarboxylic transport membrane protein